MSEGKTIMMDANSLDISVKLEPISVFPEVSAEGERFLRFYNMGMGIIHQQKDEGGRRIEDARKKVPRAHFYG